MKNEGVRPIGRFSRREALQLAAAAGAAGLLGTTNLPAGRAHAAPPEPAGQTGFGFYRFSVGDFDAAVVSDGQIVFQPVQPTWAPEASKEQIEGTLAEAFLPTDRITLHVNTMVLKRGNDLIVVDAGAGTLFGPATGKMGGRLAALGVSPEKVTAVILTHAHGDHFGGLLDKEGKPAYPNAAHFVSKTELDFWTAPEPDLSKTGIPPENRKTFIAGVQKYLGALKDRISPAEPGRSILPGIEVVGAPGHTPGHIALLVTSGKESLFNTADSVHHAIIFERPEWTLAFDVDPKQAVVTRRKILDRAASDRLRVLAYHLPFPGLGHVRPMKGAYAWVPEPWSW
jgi:glyoxylase-like metal-dependent hydrolase (beta-lactamase superfamily II)